MKLNKTSKNPKIIISLEYQINMQKYCVSPSQLALIKFLHNINDGQ